MFCENYNFSYSFDKITRIEYLIQDGTDAEESVNVYFKGIANEHYRAGGWKDHIVCIKIIIHDRYHDYTYFYGNKRDNDKQSWDYHFLSNHMAGIFYLIENNLIEK